MASANVFQQFLRPARSVADYRADMDEADMRQAQLMGAAQQRQMREFEFAQAQEAARENALTRAAYARTVAESPDEETLLSRLERSGNMGLAKEAAARRKAALDAKQAQATIGKAEQETAASKADQARKKMADDIANIMSMADPASARAQMQAATGMDEGVKARLLASVPDDPQQFGEWQMRLIMARASADAQAHARAKAAQPTPPKTREVKMSDGTIRTQEWDAATGAFRDIPGAEAAPRRPGRAPGGGGGGGGGGGMAPPRAGLTGDALLATLSAADQEIVKGLADGSIKPDAISTKGNRREQMLALAKQYKGDANLTGRQGAEDKPLPAKERQLLVEARQNAATVGGLLSDFKDAYASKGVMGVGADFALKAKAVTGTDTDSVQWWKNYRKMAELVERHAMFGASLTQGEKDSWASADISPGMDAKVIRNNLETRARITKKVLEATQQDLIDSGFGADRIQKIGGRDVSVPLGAGGRVVDFGSLK